MSFLPHSATFHERVQDCFVALRGRGVSLSASDIELVDEWAQAEVPFEVVARGLRKAAETALWNRGPGEAPLDSLRTCRKAVQAEIAKFQRLSIGRGDTSPADANPNSFFQERHKKLVAAIKKATQPHPPRWLALLKLPAHFEESERQERLVLALLWRGLPAAQRVKLLKDARAQVASAPFTSKAQRREAMWFHRGALIRQAWSLPSLW